MTNPTIAVLEQMRADKQAASTLSLALEKAKGTLALHPLTDDDFILRLDVGHRSFTICQRRSHGPAVTLKSEFTKALATLIQSKPNPVPGRGQVRFVWDALDEPVICILDHMPAERGSRQGGAQMEPDWPEGCTLGGAFLHGVDIMPILSKEQIADIECAALLDVIEARSMEADERAEARHQTMLESSK